MEEKNDAQNDAGSPPLDPHQEAPGTVPHVAATDGNVQQDAAVNGSVPQDAAGYGSVPQDAAGTGTIPQDAAASRDLPDGAEDGGDARHATTGRRNRETSLSDRREAYALTVREAMLLFEQEGVPRCERTISAWCRPNRHGEHRLEAYYDEGERRYRITEASVRRAIAEERSKDSGLGNHSSPEPVKRPSGGSAADPTGDDPSETEALRSEVLNLKIDNRAKEFFITQMTKEREQLIRSVQDSSHRIGALETELRMLGSGRPRDSDEAPVDNPVGDFEARW